MFFMEAVYLQMAASAELAKERLRDNDEHDDRTEGTSAQARSSHEGSAQQTGPYVGVSLPKGTWRIELWRGAGW